ncbi:MAG: DUF4157 domain-containing protein [Anaerolineales bacterium]|jgi:hypothetical protein
MKVKAHTQHIPKAPAPKSTVVVPIQTTELERPDLSAQLDSATPLGHSLGAIRVYSSLPQVIQRQELPEEEEEEELQMKPEITSVQRQALHGDRLAPHVEVAVQQATGGGASEVHHKIKTGLPDNLKAGLEDLSGLSLEDVRVHYNSPKPAEINAHAFTQGKDIHVASGQETCLSHEGWHVVQQAQGRVKPTVQLNDGILVNDDQGLEHEADVMAAKAVQKRRADHATFAQIAQGKVLETQDGSQPHADVRAVRSLPPQNSTGVAQRMAVMAFDDLDKQKDALVWNNIEWAVEKAGGPIGDLKENKVWNQLKDGEEIRIIEHGAVGSVGDKNAKDIADSMFTDKNKLPDNVPIGGVTFQSCYAGVGADQSLVSQMAEQLRIHNRPGVTVKGRTGIAFGFKGIDEATAETWSTPLGTEWGEVTYKLAMDNLRRMKTKESKNPIFKNLYEYSEPWDIAGILESEWKKKTADERSKLIADELVDYWEKVKEIMGTLSGFKIKDEEEVIASGT